MRIRTRTALTALPLTLTAALTVTLTGCGADGGEQEKPAPATGRTEPGGKSSGSARAGAEPSRDPQEMAVLFARCMREHGVEVADPVKGRVTIKQRKRAGGRSALEKAMKACREHRPRGVGPQSSAGAGKP
ncbi:hypothetical protein GCM10010387_42260 [Streptomyces inusitatus]|uniref:Lipoprotein n=1 Tax=Streptomyces inusitatus TaxID=68221 RepID=A0A918UYY7_9ACTN|nr:hypothetical protein [Streptomyces inusitatus]GGZ43495.1 hypothetical protein GCM10010387_42260 [Streptomyces inusitatus]